MKRAMVGVAVALLLACGGSDKATGPSTSDPTGAWHGSISYATSPGQLVNEEAVQLTVTSVATATSGPRSVAGFASFNGGTTLTATPTATFESGHLVMSFSTSSRIIIDCQLTDGHTCSGIGHGTAAGPDGTLTLKR